MEAELLILIPLAALYLLSSSSLGIGRLSNNMQSRAKRVRGRVTLGEMVERGNITHAYHLCSCFSRSLFIES